MFFGMTARARRFDRRFRVGVFFVAVAFVAFDATSLVGGFARAISDTVIGAFHVYAAAFFRGIRVVSVLVTGDAFLDDFLTRDFVRVVTGFAPLGVFRLDVRAVIEIFDHTPFRVLPPMRAFFRIA